MSESEDPLTAKVEARGVWPLAHVIITWGFCGLAAILIQRLKRILLGIDTQSVPLTEMLLLGIALQVALTIFGIRRMSNWVLVATSVMYGYWAFGVMYTLLSIIHQATAIVS